jgi:hypothetical protein
LYRHREIPVIVPSLANLWPNQEKRLNKTLDESRAIDALIASLIGEVGFFLSGRCIKHSSTVGFLAAR